MCVYLREVRRDWFCLLLYCCLSVSSTTDRDSLLFIWTPAQTFDLSKWVANPSQSYCGAHVAIPAILPPAGPTRELHQFYTSSLLQVKKGSVCWIRKKQAYQTLVACFSSLFEAGSFNKPKHTDCICKRIETITPEPFRGGGLSPSQTNSGAV